METERVSFFVNWVRWQGQDGYALWMDQPNKELYWTDAQGNIPVFSTIEGVRVLTTELGVPLRTDPPGLCDFDVVWEWLQQPRKRPPQECLTIWGLFSDVGTATGTPFDGDRKSPVRNRVFDKLYLNDGIIQLNQQGRMEFRNAHTKPWIPGWRPEERRRLKRALQQGFRLWKKFTYRAAIGTVRLP